MSKNSKDQSAKLKLIEAAKKEFFEKGYEKASLRSICNNADLTTGALYFFFKDKKDIFNYILSPLLDEINTLITAHYRSEQTSFSDVSVILPTDNSEDIKTAVEVLRTMYKHRQECLLFLNTPDVSSIFINNIIKYTESHYSSVFEILAGTDQFDHYIIHWISHMQIDAFIHLFLHEENEDKAIAKVPDMVNFMIGGTYKVLEKIKNDSNS